MLMDFHMIIMKMKPTNNYYYYAFDISKVFGSEKIKLISFNTKIINRQGVTIIPMKAR